TEYGSISVIGAAPGSEIVLDGGTAGHAAADGSLLLPSVLVGQREVRIRGASGAVVSRMVSVIKGRTLLVAPVTDGMGAPPQPPLKPAGKKPEGCEEVRGGACA